jgi:hypothetical protein
MILNNCKIVANRKKMQCELEKKIILFKTHNTIKTPQKCLKTQQSPHKIGLF